MGMASFSAVFAALASTLSAAFNVGASESERCIGSLVVARACAREFLLRSQARILYIVPI